MPKNFHECSEVVGLTPPERVQRLTAEYMVDVPVLFNWQEIVGVARLVPHEREQQINEQIFPCRNRSEQRKPTSEV